MWIFTETGFISAVRKPEYPNLVTVRSRDRASLTSIANFASVDIAKSPNGDYPYRAFVDSGLFAQWLFEQAEAIRYSNFKSHIAKSRGYEYAHELGRVWSVMLSTEDADARVLPESALNTTCFTSEEFSNDQ
jgi:hypothetical protein